MASVQKRPNGKWRARYRDPAGREHARHFDRKRDAQQWLDAVAGDLVRGVHVDPRAGQRTFGSFAGEWLAAQTFDVSTREAVESRLRVHVLPTFGPMRLAAIRPSTVQAWVKGRADQLAASTVRVLLANLSAILGAAVEDGLLVRNPCSSRSVRAPSEERERIVPWSTERVQAVIDAHPDRWRGSPIVAAGCGLRQGEVFGLTVENVQFLRRSMRVAQQVKIVGGRPVFALPKGGKVREVPLASSVATELAEHLRQHPAVEVTLPWGSPNGEPVTSELVFVTRQRGPLVRSYYNRGMWQPALDAAGVERSRANGMHALRHYYASVLLDAGESIRAVADYLGHADPGFTMRTYTHLMPSSEDRARRAIDAAFGPPADSLRTDDADQG